jgi:hypothetical protein
MARCHHLLIVLPLFLALASAAPGHGQGHHGEASAVFIDAAPHRYLRDQQTDDQGTSMSFNEVSAAVSVLLGFAPPAALPVLSSSQLNKLLIPNPFDRPGAVFLVQIAGSNGMPVVVECLYQYLPILISRLNYSLLLVSQPQLIASYQKPAALSRQGLKVQTTPLQGLQIRMN